MTEREWTWLVAGGARYAPNLIHKFTAGRCLPEFDNCEILIDPCAPIRSGDYVRMRVDYTDGAVLDLVKQVRYSRVAQRWYCIANDADGVERAIAMPNLLKPTFCQKVIARRSAGRPVFAPAFEKAPSPETTALYGDSSRRAREEWATSGVDREQVFPHDSICVEPRVLSATLPESNVQQPAAPLNFEIETIGNLINFDWTAPEVLPLGTKFQLFAAPWSLSHIDSKTLFWEGSDEGKTLAFSATSPWFFQLRAHHGSYYSDFTPNTLGVAATPIYTAPAEPSSGSWSLSLSPTAIYKTQVGTSTITAGPATGVVVGSASAVFSWTWVGSAIGINSPGANATAFVASGMTLNELRSGTAWLNVADGANTSSKSIGITILREPPEGGG